MMQQMMPQRMPMPQMRNPENGMMMSPNEQQQWINFQQRHQDEQQRAAAAAQFHQQRMPMHPNMGYMMGPRGPMIRPGGEFMHSAMMRAVAPQPPQQVAAPPPPAKGKKRKNNQAAPQPQPMMQVAPAPPPPHQMRMMGPGPGAMMYDEYGNPMMSHPMQAQRGMMPQMNSHQQHEILMMQQHAQAQHGQQQQQQQHLMPMQQRPNMPPAGHMQMPPQQMGAMYPNLPPPAAQLGNSQQPNDIFSGTSDDDLAVLNELYNPTSGEDIFSNIEPFLCDKLPPSAPAQNAIGSQPATAAPNSAKFAQFHQQGTKGMVAVAGPMQIDLQHQQSYSSNNKQQVPPGGGRPGAESNNSNTFIYTQMSIQQLNIQNVNGQSFGGNIQQMNMNTHQHQQQFVNIAPGGQNGPMPPNFGGAGPHAPRPPPPGYANAAGPHAPQPPPPPNAQMRMEQNFCPPGSVGGGGGGGGGGYVEPITNVEAKVPSANISYRPQAPQQNQSLPSQPQRPSTQIPAGYATMSQGVNLNVQQRVASGAVAADVFGFADVVEDLNGSLCGQPEYSEMMHHQQQQRYSASTHMRGGPVAGAGPPPAWPPGGPVGDFGAQNFEAYDFQQFSSSAPNSGTVRSRTGAGAS